MKKSIWLNFIRLLTVIIALLCFNCKTFALSDFVISNISPGETGNMLILKGKNNDGKNDLQVIHLDNPDRAVIDIPNAILAGKKRSLNHVFKGIKHVKIAQFSTNPNIVRIVMMTDSKDSFEKIEISGSQDSLVFKLNDIEQSKPATKTKPKKHLIVQQILDKFNKNKEKTSLSDESNIAITTVKHEKNNVILAASGNIIAKKPFSLENPSRIIYDLPNTILASKELSKIFTLKNNDVIKIGQFEQKTARIVIKTQTPENYEVIIPSETQSLIVRAKNNPIITEALSRKIASPAQNIITHKNTIMPVNFNLGLRGKIVIDPGHGGLEPGAQKNGIFEKDITLDVAKRVADYLTKAGIKVILTRTDDSTLSLKQRVDITNAENPDAFVSIHVNSSEDPGAIGMETHWFNRQSEPLALDIQKNIVNIIPSPNRGVKNSMFYVIHHTEIPAALVEIGFISNDFERYQLLQDERKNATAKAISTGVLEYLGLKYSAEKPEIKANSL